MVRSATKRAAVSGLAPTDVSYVCWKCRRSLATLPATSRRQQEDVLARQSRQPKAPRKYANNRFESVKPTGTISGSDGDSGGPGQFVGLQFFGNEKFGTRSNIKRIEDELRQWQLEDEKQRAAEREHKAEEAYKGMSPLTELLLRAKTQRIAESDYDEGVDDAESDNAFLDSSEEMRGSLQQRPLQPGELVDFAGQCRLAVYVKPGHGYKANKHSLLYGMDGMIYDVRESAIEFRSAGFISPAELKEILPYFPMSDVTQVAGSRANGSVGVVPRGFGAPIIRKMSQFRKEAAELYRSNASRLDNSHGILADEDVSSTVTLQDATRKLLNVSDKVQPSPVQLWSVHRALTGTETGFRRARFYYASPKWTVLSQRDVSVIDSVEDWWHSYQTRKMNLSFEESLKKSPRSHLGKQYTAIGEIEDFIKSARTLVTERRQLRHQNPRAGVLGPVKDNIKPTIATSSDPDAHKAQLLPQELGNYPEKHVSILRFLTLTIFEEVYSLSSSAAIAGMIVRETRLYEYSDDHRQLILLFLQEMGVLSPWEDLSIARLRLLQPDNTPASVKDKIRPQPENQATIPENFVDSVKDIRKDWGDIDVYCIDGQGTQIVDDGISIEQVEGDESQLWIHVHVANPTAFLHKDHSFAKRACAMGCSLYTPNARFTMMDELFTLDVASLQSGRPCLTFSARLDENGDTLEHQVTHGIVRNVSFVTPEVIKEVIGIHNTTAPKGESVVIQVGPEETTDTWASNRRMKEPSDLTQSQVKDLKNWHRFMEASFKKRIGKRLRLPDAMRSMRGPDLIVRNAPPIPPDCTSIRAVGYDPTIRAEVYPGQQFTRYWMDQVDVVAEAMLLAGTVAASWCTQRGIPVPFFGRTEVEGVPSSRRYFLEVLQPLLHRGQSIPRKLVTDMLNLPSPSLDITGRPNEQQGVDALVNVTSPLRQWSHMLAHFQIDAALRHEARKKKKQVQRIPHEHLPYSPSQMSTECRDLESRLSIARSITRSKKMDWMLRLIGRCLYFGEATLPQRLTAYVYMKTNFVNNLPPVIKLRSTELRVNCVVEDWSDNVTSEVKWGDVFEIEMLGLEHASGSVRVRAGKRVSRLPEFLEKEEIEQLQAPEAA